MTTAITLCGNVRSATTPTDSPLKGDSKMTTRMYRQSLVIMFAATMLLVNVLLVAVTLLVLLNTGGQ